LRSEAVTFLAQAHAGAPHRPASSDIDGSPRDPSAVDNEEMTNNEAGLIGAQKQHRGCQFLSFAHPANGKKIARLFGRDVLLFHPLVENVARRVNTAGSNGCAVRPSSTSKQVTRFEFKLRTNLARVLGARRAPVLS